jgi:hypothetical protein
VITLSDKVSELTGALLGPSPASDYAVVIAPADRRYWRPGARRIQMIQPVPAGGRFLFRGLPPGAYLLGVAQDVAWGEHDDPIFLQELARTAVPVTITESGRHVQDVRVLR